MISYEQFHLLKALQERELSAGQIAHTMGIAENTARLWMSRDRYEPKRPSCPRPGKLDDYKDRIAQLLAECVDYSAVQLHNKIEREGYDGSYSLVKDYVRKIRPPKRKVYEELIFAPGEAAQVDFGECGLTDVGGTRRKLYVFVMVLCHSRLMYVEFILRQALEHFLSCHRRAFEAFGGVPHAVIVDRTKCAILGNDPFGKPIPNPRYADFSRHYHFDIRACDAYCPHQKGRVESGVKYVKGNFVRGRGIELFEGVGPAATQWLEEVANRRIHASTNQRPVDRYEQSERSAMQPVPAVPYDCAIVHDKLVNKQARFSYDGNRYSVLPQYAPGKVTVHVLPESLTVYADGDLIARHARCYQKRSEAIVDPEHNRQLRRQRRRSEDRKIVQRFLALGQPAVTYYEGLQQRTFGELAHVRKIMALAEYHGGDSLLAALRDAASHSAFSADYIANLLQFRTAVDEPSPLHLTRNTDLLDIDLPEPDLGVYDRERRSDNLQQEQD